MFFTIRLFLTKVSPKTTVNGITKLFTRPATFSARDLVVHESHGETGTLNARFVRHLALENCKFDPIIPQTIKYSDYFPVQDVRSFNSAVEGIPIDQIARLVVFTYTYKTNGDPQKVAQVLNKIDEICVKNIDQFEYENLLEVLYAFMFTIPNKITRLQFYERAMRRLLNEFKPSLPKERFIQVSFYLGLWKRNMHSNKMMNQLFSEHLESYLDKMSTLDFAIVSNAAYKTSLIINEAAFNERLVREVESSDCKDDALLVSFVKSIRLNRIKSPQLCAKLKSHLLSGKMDGFHFKGLVHCFAYFSENLWNDPEVCDLFAAKCLELLQTSDEVFNDMRAKDLATFLWCCANLGLDNLNNSDVELIEEQILRKVDEGKYRNCPDELIDSALSLWMLGYKSKEIVSEVIHINGQNTTRNSERIKLDSRLRLLLNCVQIEKPEWIEKKRKAERCFVEDRKAPDYLITKRKGLPEVVQLLEENKSELGLVSSSIVCPISDLNIPGIFVETKQGKGYLEVAEDNQLLKFSSKLVSILQLKVALLKSLGYNVQMIVPSEYQNSSELVEALKESINSLEGVPQAKEAVA